MQTVTSAENGGTEKADFQVPTCYTKHTSYIITHMRKALYSQFFVILMLLFGSRKCLMKRSNRINMYV